MEWNNFRSNVNGQSVLSNLGIGFIGWEEEYTFYANEGEELLHFGQMLVLGIMNVVTELHPKKQ